MYPWCKQYIGIPYQDHGRDRDGLDCWGLVRLVYREQFRIALPGFDEDYPTANDRAAVMELIRREAVKWEVVPRARLGDLFVFRIGRKPSHVGVALDFRHMLHTLKHQNASVERVNTPFWHKRRVMILRHPELAG